MKERLGSVSGRESETRDQPFHHPSTHRPYLLPSPFHAIDPAVEKVRKRKRWHGKGLAGESGRRNHIIHLMTLFLAIRPSPRLRQAA